MDESIWVGVIIIALYIWAETYSCIKANRQAAKLAEMKRQKVAGSSEMHIDLRG